MPKRDNEKKSGPEPEHLEIEGDWEQAVEKAMEKKRPPDGWPKPKKRKDRP